MSIRVESFPSAAEFWPVVRDYLYKEPDMNATIIATTNMIIEGEPVFQPPHWFGVIRNDRDDIVGCAMHTLPDGLLTYGVSEEDAGALFGAVSEEMGCPVRIVAPEGLCNELADRWKNSEGKSITLDNDWNVYKLLPERLNLRDSKGTLRLGTGKEEELIRLWGDQYAEEKPAFLSIADYLARKLGRGELYVWDDGGARSLVTVSRGSEDSLKISGVFTPEENRGAGYAGAAVSLVCKRLFEDGAKFVTLMTQAGDPVERLYERIGFEAIGSRKSVSLG